MNAAGGLYRGTHNFHNYTVRDSPDDPSAFRYILSFECEPPFEVNGVRFVRCVVVGQSFIAVGANSSASRSASSAARGARRTCGSR